MHRTANRKTTYTVCIIVLLAFFVLFAARLADWQLIRGEEYRSLASRSTGFTVKTDATRGEILDRNGNGLVVNKTHYKIVIDKLYVDEENLDSTLLSLIELVGKTGEKRADIMPIAESNGGYRFINTESEELEILLSEEFLDFDSNASAGECVEKLRERYEIDGNYNPEQLRNLISVHYGMERGGYSASTPYVFAEDISRETASAISENTQGVSGVDVQTYLVREAENPTLAPHTIGALGSLSQEEYAKLADKGYELNDSIGKFGIELAFEDQLKGTGGMKIISRNSDGTIVDTVETVDAKPGNTVWLTLDSKLQETAVKSLETNVKAAKINGKAESESSGKKLVGEDCETGAVVMIDVKDFSVLAAASYPTYDLNKYSEYDDYYVKLSNNKYSPMFNRAFVGTFAWGSVFKPCVALAALEEKIITTQTEINCTQYYDYYPTNIVECMHYHGNENVTSAITQSCNYFFAETGRRLGIDTMYLYAERLGLGEYTGLEIEESKGVLAGRDSTVFQAGNTVQAAIGQSDNSFTPVQLATYAATIANNGTRLKTHIVSKITDYERNEVIADFSEPEKVVGSGVSKENLDIVRNAMLNVTQSADGTAYSMFGDYKVKVAAKTGTAENSGSDHTTFICYAPYDKPEVAVAVVLEHGAKGRYSMQVAKDLLDEYFK